MALRLLRPLLSSVTRRGAVAMTTRTMSAALDMPDDSCPVCVYNEWDPLEEVIMGRAEGANFPQLRPEFKALIKPESQETFGTFAGHPYPAEELEIAVKEVDEFERVLTGEGVKVRRPELVEWSKVGAFTTPDWTEPSGWAMACPRDSMTVVGNEILESPMAFRARYFESRPLKKLLNDYFEQGARWTLAPKPTMTDDCYRDDYPFDDLDARTKEVAQGKYILTEKEPMFDAAELQRVGKDIFYQLSHTANFKGLEWMKRHFGRQGYRVHGVNCMDTHAMHIDCTLVFLKPGVVLMNPDRPCLQIDLIKKAGWDVYECPRPSNTDGGFYASYWLSMNVLMLDENRLVMYSKEPAMQKFFKEKFGMECIGVDLTTAFNLGGGYHCWTGDIRRRGSLQDYGFGGIDFDSALNRYFEPKWHQTKYIK